jgi:hypothetical protein
MVVFQVTEWSFSKLLDGLFPSYWMVFFQVTGRPSYWMVFVQVTRRPSYWTVFSSQGNRQRKLPGSGSALALSRPFSRPIHPALSPRATQMAPSRRVIELANSPSLPLAPPNPGRHHRSPFLAAAFTASQKMRRVLFPFSTKLAAGLRSVARNNKATRLLTRPG